MWLLLEVESKQYVVTASSRK